MNNFCVYLHTNKTNGKVYIGITSQEPEQRWRGGNGYSTQHFSRAIKKYGWDGFKHEILYSNLSETKAKILEVSLIHYYKSANPKYGYNISEGGDIISEETRKKISEANKGKVISEETRKKLSEAHKGANHPNYGKHLSEETKAKISEAHKGANNYMYGKRGAETPMYGKHHTEEAKAKISKANKGKVLSEETRKKMSEAQKGKVLSEEHRAKLSEINKGKVLSEETKFKISEAKKGTVLSEETKVKISEALKGANSHLYGNIGFKHPKSKSCICLTTGFTFGSTREAGRYYDIDYRSIGSCCRGKYKSAGKFNGIKLQWKYICDLPKPKLSYEDKQHLKDMLNKYYKIQ